MAHIIDCKLNSFCETSNRFNVYENAKYTVINWKIYAGIAQLVERNLAKVEVASSSLVSRSILGRILLAPILLQGHVKFLAPCNVWAWDDFFNKISSVVLAGWQSGYAAACKAADAGSIPTPAYIEPSTKR